MDKKIIEIINKYKQIKPPDIHEISNIISEHFYINFNSSPSSQQNLIEIEISKKYELEYQNYVFNLNKIEQEMKEYLKYKYNISNKLFNIIWDESKNINTNNKENILERHVQKFQDLINKKIYKK